MVSCGFDSSIIVAFYGLQKCLCRKHYINMSNNKRIKSGGTGIFWDSQTFWSQFYGDHLAQYHIALTKSFSEDTKAGASSNFNWKGVDRSYFGRFSQEKNCGSLEKNCTELRCGAYPKILEIWSLTESSNSCRTSLTWKLCHSLRGSLSKIATMKTCFHNNLKSKLDQCICSVAGFRRVVNSGKCKDYIVISVSASQCIFFLS